MQSLFLDRREAGRLLAERVSPSVLGEDVLVLGLPRGGVAVAYEVARALGAPLDVFVLRRLEVPGRETVMGAIAAGGVRVLDRATIAAHRVPESTIEQVARHEALELTRIERRYRSRRPAPKMMGRTIVLVDDGSSSARWLASAVSALSAYRPARVVVAVPTATAAVARELEASAGQVAYALGPEESEGQHIDGQHIYEDDSDISDRDVRHLLTQAGGHDHHVLAG